MPRHDNTFGGGNFDADDLDEWLTIQRDWQVDAGIEPVSEDEVLRVRERAARAVQAVFAELGLPADLRRRGRGRDRRLRRSTTCPTATARPTSRRPTTCSRAASPASTSRSRSTAAGSGRSRRRCSRCSASGCPPTTCRPRRSSTPTGSSTRPSTIRTTTRGPAPATGSRASAGQLLQSLPQVVDPAELLGEDGGAEPDRRSSAARRRRATTRPRSSSRSVRRSRTRSAATIADLDHREVLEAVCDGIREGGGEPRLVRVRRVADVAFIAHDGARLSGSGVALGIQSKGTAVIHRADLQPLDNLELFGMSPLYTLESYRAMGRNAAGYALGQRVGPVPTQLDNFARAKLIVRTTLLHARETQAIVPRCAAVELELVARPSPRAHRRSSSSAGRVPLVSRGASSCSSRARRTRARAADRAWRGRHAGGRRPARVPGIRPRSASTAAMSTRRAHCRSGLDVAAYTVSRTVAVTGSQP